MMKISVRVSSVYRPGDHLLTFRLLADDELSNTQPASLRLVHDGEGDDLNRFERIAAEGHQEFGTIDAMPRLHSIN